MSTTRPRCARPSAAHSRSRRSSRPGASAEDLPRGFGPLFHQTEETTMKLQPRSALAAVAAAAAVLSAPAIAQQNKAEVIHWWTSGGESAAIQEIATAYQK